MTKLKDEYKKIDAMEHLSPKEKEEAKQLVYENALLRLQVLLLRLKNELEEQIMNTER